VLVRMRCHADTIIPLFIIIIIIIKKIAKGPNKINPCCQRQTQTQTQKEKCSCALTLKGSNINS